MPSPRARLLILAAASALLLAAVAALWTLREGAPDPGPGLLVARPGMSREEMDAASTLALPSGDVGAIAGEGVFEFRVAGTGLSFPGARTYYVAATGPALQIDRLLVSVSGRLTGPEREAAHAATRGKLMVDGWAQQGGLWKKDGLVLEVTSAQVEEPPEGQTAEEAPVWVQSVALRKE